MHCTFLNVSHIFAQTEWAKNTFEMFNFRWTRYTTDVKLKKWLVLLLQVPNKHSIQWCFTLNVMNAWCGMAFPCFNKGFNAINHILCTMYGYSVYACMWVCECVGMWVYAVIKFFIQKPSSNQLENFAILYRMVLYDADVLAKHKHVTMNFKLFTFYP